METITDKLIQIGGLTHSRDIDYVIDGGDVFDRKSPALNSHGMVRLIADIHNKHYKCPVYCNVGNHDCIHGDLQHIDSQPLGVLFATGQFKRLYNENELIIEKAGIKVRVVGVPYHGVRYDLKRLDIKKKDEDFLVVNAHLLASKYGRAMFESEDIIPYSELVGLDADVMCFGHWHKDQGITEIAKNKYVVNVGSLTRGALAEDHLTRNPCVVSLMFSQEGIKIERIDLRVKPSSECFDLEKKEKNREREESKEAINSVISLLKNVNYSEKHSSLYDDIRGMNLKQNLKERAILFLEEAEKDA
jgi:DNA repair exonuclease SbcCD nuclease subunit